MRRRRSMRAARAPSPRADSLLASTTSGAAAASRTSRSSETTRTFIWMGARPTCHGRAGSRRKGERWRGRADLSVLMIRLTSLTRYGSLTLTPRAASNSQLGRRAHPTRGATRPHPPGVISHEEPGACARSHSAPAISAIPRPTGGQRVCRGVRHPACRTFHFAHGSLGAKKCTLLNGSNIYH